ncbi:MAG TPA: PBP1A family penicillin-binding protein [Myxococcota bacterium]|nr:PBP1A family penicillin-binding protein [Myxococcota bacterium]HRY93525.1 PBP1A family penicillin-binding protein [Myxococcota bacterium]HSA20546.1 PBP1A family penicillin-binding protein [Myxococcota bacterium]
MVAGSGKQAPRLLVANPRRRRSLLVRVPLWMLACLAFWFAGGSLGILSIYLAVEDSVPELPRLDQYNPPATTRLYSHDGTLLAEFAIERRDVMPQSQIPRRLVQAFIASEDDNFFNHAGIDPMGILRAALKNLQAGKVVQGGSTITQQVAKTFVGREKTFTRKFKEAILARRLETTFGKEDILYLYLNQIYLGHGSHGVQAAARNYFHKNVWELDLGEMTAIAGLPQAPSEYDPVARPEAARERRSYVLERMQAVGFAAPAEAEAAAKAPIQARPIVDIFRQRSPYFSEEVRRQLQQRYGTEGVYEAGLTVETTLDLDYQLAAQQVMNDGIVSIDHRQGYRGPLLHLAEPAERQKLLEAAQKHFVRMGWLDEAGELPMDQPLLAIVDEVSESRALVSVGLARGLLPVMGMRWARDPDPTVHYQSASARVNDVRRKLKPGDVILVRRTSADALMRDEPPALRKVLEDPPGVALLRLDQIPAVQGALVTTEPQLGYVKAIIGGYNFDDSEFNRVLQACRQPGSAFKPITYSLAIQEKEYNPAKVLIDSAVVYDDPENQNRWKPENFDADFKGKVTVHMALVNSMNVPAIKVLDDVGIPETIAWAHKLGLTTPLREELGLALGSSCLKPWDLTQVYAVFNQGGRRTPAEFVRKVTDRWGRVLLNRTSPLDPWQSWDEKLDRGYDRLARPPEQLIEPRANYILLHLLEGVASRGTAANARSLGAPVAGKTGTTNDSADAWFVGFTRDLVTTVWVGNDEPKDPLGRGETGSRAAVPMWVSYMRQALGERPQGEFEVPPGITFARIDPSTGLLARPGTPHSVMEAFLQGKEPKEYLPSADVAAPDQFFKVDRMY